MTTPSQAGRIFAALRAGLLAIAALTAAAPASFAQNLFDPAIKVNDSVVTTYELSQRIAFLTLLRAPGNLPEVATEQLINERLQLQAAEAMDITVSDEDVQTGMEEFASRANLSADEFIKAIAQGGIAAESFRDFVRAGVAWREVVRARFVRQVDVTDAEVDRAIAALARNSGVRVLLSEIILPANTPAAARASTQRAAALSQITTLPAFASAARRYSASPSRGRSGRLDWIELSNLPPQVAAQVLPLAPGEVTDPIPTQNGIALFQMRAIEETGAQTPQDINIAYAIYLIPGGRSEKALAAVQKIDDETDTCDDLYGIAKGQPDEVLTRESQPLAEIPTDIALELAKLDEGEISAALTSADGQTLRMLMLCSRASTLPEDVSRDTILQRLRNQRLNKYADAYLQELKADAHIETLTTP